MHFIFLARSPPPPSLATGIVLGILLLELAQLWAIKKEKEYAWVLSMVQFLTIFFAGIGTFGFIIAFVVKPVPHTELITYVVSGLIVLAEGLKTVYLFNYSKG